MRSKPFKLKKKLALTSAVNLALLPSLVVAADTGKGAEPNSGQSGEQNKPLASPECQYPECGRLPQLSLNQISKPLEAIIPPINDSELSPQGGIFENDLADFETEGLIFVEDIADGEVRIDFIVSNIRNDIPVDIFLAFTSELAPFEDGEEPDGLKPKFSGDRPWMEDEDMMGPESSMMLPEGGMGPEGQPRPKAAQRPKVSHKPGQRPAPRPKAGTGAKPPKPLLGTICLGLENVQILAGIHLQPSRRFMPSQTNAFGDALKPSQSIIIPVRLSELEKFMALGDNLYFQAVAFPAGNYDLEKSQASECDRFYIAWPKTDEVTGETTGGKTDIGVASDSTTGDTGGKITP